MSCSFHAVSKLNSMWEKVSETSPRLHFLVDSKLVPRDPARKYWLPSRKLAKNPFDVGEYLSIPHIEITRGYSQIPWFIITKFPIQRFTAVVSWLLRMGSAWYCIPGSPELKVEALLALGQANALDVGTCRLLLQQLEVSSCWEKTMQPQPDSLDTSTYTITHTYIYI